MIMMVGNRPSNKLYGWIRRKISKVMSIQQSGEKNSQFGTKWINNPHTKETKKLLKNAFRLKRSDITNLKNLTSTVELGANLPLEAKAERKVTGNSEKVDISLTWNVKVKVPLIGGMLEKHAEGEIRKFSQLEIEIVEDELKKQL